MLKPRAASSRGRKRTLPWSAESLNAVEGQVSELCRDLAEQLKRMQQLREQADELRTVIHQWAGQTER